MNAYNKRSFRDSTLQRPTLNTLLQSRRSFFRDANPLADPLDDLQFLPAASPLDASRFSRRPGTADRLAYHQRPGTTGSCERSMAWPTSGTNRFWTPPTSLFSTIGLQSVVDRPYPPLPSRNKSRSTGPRHGQTSPTVDSLPDGFFSRPVSRHVHTEDPILGLPYTAVPDTRDWISTSHAAHGPPSQYQGAAFGLPTRVDKLDGSLGRLTEGRGAKG